MGTAKWVTTFAAFAAVAGVFWPVLATERQLQAELIDSKGQSVGKATVTQLASGVLEVKVDGRNLPPTEHGVHLHAVGRCDAPSFTSAGSHYNPVGLSHGLENPKGAHAGDLANLTVRPDGTTSYTSTTWRASLEPLALNTLLDADGVALIIHARADDNRTDPTGNSGDRIACGVLQPANQSAAR